MEMVRALAETVPAQRAVVKRVLGLPREGRIAVALCASKLALAVLPLIEPTGDSCRTPSASEIRAAWAGVPIPASLVERVGGMDALVALVNIMLREVVVATTLDLHPDDDPWGGMREAFAAAVARGEEDWPKEWQRQEQEDMAKALAATSVVDAFISAHGRRVKRHDREDFKQEIYVATVAGLGVETPRRRRGRYVGRPKSPAWALQTYPSQLKVMKRQVKNSGGRSVRPRSVDVGNSIDAATSNERDERDDAIDAALAAQAVERLAAKPGVNAADVALMRELAATLRKPKIRDLARRTGIDKSKLSRRWKRVRERLQAVPEVAGLLDA